VESPYGTFGNSAAYFNDFRWQRLPSENMAFGRVFRIKERASFQIRAEFQNIFNRLFYSTPSDGAGFAAPFVTITTPTAHANNYGPNGATKGLLSSGFGYVNWVNGGSALPRSGQIVARFTF
jgi:hypothetical protein